MKNKNNPQSPSAWSTPVRTMLCTAAVLLVALARPVDVAAAMLQVSGGELTGATGVQVAGQRYNVSFMDDTCAALFSGCDAVSDFPFQSESAARAASAALLEQVFNADFGTNPAATRGCEDLAECIVGTPFTIAYTNDVLVAGLLNSANPIGDFVITYGTRAEVDYFAYSRFVYAVWSPDTTSRPVPEPGTLALLCCGLAALGVTRRRFTLAAGRVPATRPGSGRRHDR